MTDSGVLPALLAWLTGTAWPRWLDQGIDWQRRGFHEHLALDGSGCTADFRRLRVAARQVYVFAQASRYRVARAPDALALGIEFLLRTARQPDGGYAWRFDLDHRVIDDRRDLYDHAFVLLALAAAHRAAPAPALREAALQLEHYLQTHFHHPAGGYRESLPEALPRRQNPHMHLLEAMLAASEAFGDAVFLQRAHALVDLLLQRLVDRATLTLPEWFDDDLGVQRQDGRHGVEPGHLCEWIWLLHEYGRLGDPAAPRAWLPVSSAFARFTALHGSRPGQADLIDEVWSDGRPSQTGARLWPQAERLKAALLEPACMPQGPLAAARALQAWLRDDGLWHERRASDGRWSSEPAPASSLYHLSCAILFAHDHGAPPARQSG